MKIKNFICHQINSKGLKIIEDEVNDFTTTHEVMDVKVSILCNQFGSVVIYTVIYKGEE